MRHELLFSIEILTSSTYLPFFLPFFQSLLFLLPPFYQSCIVTEGIQEHGNRALFLGKLRRQMIEKWRVLALKFLKSSKGHLRVSSQ